jgi:hypothetical protein
MIAREKTKIFGGIQWVLKAKKGRRERKEASKQTKSASHMAPSNIPLKTPPLETHISGIHEK